MHDLQQCVRCIYDASTSYLPRDSDEARCINAANAIVGNEPWHKERVAGHAHDGLAF
ncbi:MAG: hypothetical protein H0U13_12810 [Gemmatimonadaceae bacterium]|nr:hypothetical protein [Gemmatimonadaceae bacterium]